MSKNDAIPHLVEVAVSLPIFQTYHYRIPSRLAEQAALGKRVEVPFGQKSVIGYIIGFPEKSHMPEGKLKEISEILDPEPLFYERTLEFLAWVSRYYFTPLGIVLKESLPAGINPTSKRCYQLTFNGKYDLEFGHLPKEIRSFLEIIDDHKLIPADKVEHILGLKEKSAGFRELVRKGYIERSERLERARVRERFEDYLYLTEGADNSLEENLKRRAPEQARLLNQLKGRSPIPLKELSGEFKNPRSVARRLCGAGFAEIHKERVERKPFSMQLSSEPAPKHLSLEQQNALNELKAALGRGTFATYLLQGVTGSGKTEVYIRLIQYAVLEGKGAIVLVPEISLTPQLTSRFESRFSPDEIVVQHSGLSEGQRYDQWQRIKSGKAKIVIGSRLSVFAPLDNLGVIVVDEEHESAYKQEDGFPYHARDLAVYRGQKDQCVVVLGSATPSMESAFNARSGKYKLLLLQSRIDHRALPEIEVVDLRERFQRDEVPAGARDLRLKDTDQVWNDEIFAPAFRKALVENSRAGFQSLVFLNRRGFSSFLVCLDCGHRFLCPNCSVSLTWHEGKSVSRKGRGYEDAANNSYLLCHYCGYKIASPDVCPQCYGVRLVNFGLGTERIEKELKGLLPDARIFRMDRDTMKGRAAYFEVMDKLEQRQIDVLVGTQMVAKGHDLPGVTLVGVLLADLSLNLPDFRASERTFQLVTQVAGRAGRGRYPGRVIIQTFNPDHYSIRCALAHDYESFYRQELEVRKALGYPPWGRLANFRISAYSSRAVAEGASELGKIARKVSRRKNYREGLRVLGPAPAPLSRLRRRSRWQMLVRAQSSSMLGSYCSDVYREISGRPVARRVRFELDRDPFNLL